MVIAYTARIAATHSHQMQIKLSLQYHFRIGKSLYLANKGRDADEIILSIADQMMKGVCYLAHESLESQIDIAKLYYSSCMKAVDCSDYASSRSYLKIALSLLPIDCWETQYDLCHQITLRLAKSYYSCGDVEEARCLLKELMEHSRSIEDKMPVQALIVTSEYIIAATILEVISFLSFVANFVASSLSFRPQFICPRGMFWKLIRFAMKYYPRLARTYQKRCIRTKRPQ